GCLVAVGRAVDQLPAAVPDDGRVSDRAALRRTGGAQAVGGAGAVRGDQRAAGLQERRYLADRPPADDRGAEAGSAHAARVLERVLADDAGVVAAAHDSCSPGAHAHGAGGAAPGRRRARGGTLMTMTTM